MSLLRAYAPDECATDGYPWSWHRCERCQGKGEVFKKYRYVFRGHPGTTIPCDDCDATGSIKDMVRERADHRCQRCQHPFKVGESGAWEASTELPEPPKAEALLRLIAYSEEQDSDPRARAAAIQEPRSILWSPCDERCTHGGPIRVGESLIKNPQKMAGSYALTWETSAAWRVLTVHHLTGEKADCRWWNLVPLCQRCHLHVQKKVDMNRIWAWEHTDWFKPYVAGWYAWVYEKREITREEADERQEELLALERMV